VGLVFLVLFLSCGCSLKSTPSSLNSSGSSVPQQAQQDSWKLQSNTYDQANPPFLAQGGIGLRLGPLGDGKDSSGAKPIPDSFFAENQYSPDEKIRTGTNLLGAKILINNEPLGGIFNYRQVLDLKTGILTTSWDVLPQHSNISVSVSCAIHNRNIAAIWTVKAPRGTTVSWMPCTPTSFTNEKGFAANLQISIVVKDARTRISHQISQISETVDKPGPLVFGESFAAPLNFQGWPEGAGINYSNLEPLAKDPISVLKNCKKFISNQSKTTIDIDGPVADQQAIHSFLYYLQNGEGYAVSPMGLSSSAYDGHVFWDADTWLEPALYFVNPNEVASFENYRLMRLYANPQSSKSKQPGGPFPWESAVSGRELTTIMNRELHVNGDVLWNLRHCEVLGIVPKSPSGIKSTNSISEAQRLIQSFWQKAISKREDGFYDMNQVTSPDENHTGNDDLYTNLLIQWSLNGCTWKKTSPEQLYLPKDSQTFLNYSNDPIRAYKQDAGLLAIYPLQFPTAEKQAEKMLNRFENLNLPNGPAMSKSINALIWARLGKTKKAYSEWEASWRNYVRTPFLLFSEKPDKNRTYFFTGAGGCLQTVIYGFLGFRVDEMPIKNASWVKNLRQGQWLSISPHLPAEWKSATFRNFHLLGKTYTLVVRRNSNGFATTVSQTSLGSN